MSNDKVSFSLRIEAVLFEKLKFIANKKMRSINSQYEYFLLKAVEDYENQYGPIQIKENQT